MKAIEVINLKDNFILKEISFLVFEGEFVLITGPSGAGKTTLFRYIADLSLPLSGDIFLFEKNLYNYSFKEVKSIVGFVMQEHVMFPGKVLDNIVISAKYNKKVIDKKIVENIAKDLNIYDILNKNAEVLSLGQKQRISIARVLLNKVKILLLDEPTSSLDLANKENFISLLKKLKSTYNLTILVISHEIDFFSSYIDKLIYIDDGKISYIKELKNE